MFISAFASGVCFMGMVGHLTRKEYGWSWLLGFLSVLNFILFYYQ